MPFFAHAGNNARLTESAGNITRTSDSAVAQANSGFRCSNVT